MSSLHELAVNSSLYVALSEQARSTYAFLVEFFGSCISYLPVPPTPGSLDLPAGSLSERLLEAFIFGETELVLLKTFTVILLLTLLLIILSWRVYGKRICERFMKPATSATIEQLKESVSKLKLPKEHTPRI